MGYNMYAIPKIDLFIALTSSINSIWMLGIWRMNQAKERQGLFPDPDFLRIQDIGL